MQNYLTPLHATRLVLFGSEDQQTKFEEFSLFPAKFLLLKYAHDVFAQFHFTSLAVSLPFPYKKSGVQGKKKAEPMRSRPHQSPHLFSQKKKA